MEKLEFPTESDFRQWISEAVKDGIEKALARIEATKDTNNEKLLSRKEVAQYFKISLVTLNDWMKRGLPYHKQRGRVYFLFGEVLGHVKATRRKDLS